MGTITYSQTTDDPLTPELLVERLMIDRCDLEALVRDCHMDPEELRQLFYTKATQDHLQFRIDLHIAEARLMAAEMLLDCMDVLERLTKSDKPEVARRAATTLLNIAGVQTNPAKPIKVAPPAVAEANDMPQKQNAPDHQNRSSANTQFRTLNASLRAVTHPIIPLTAPTPYPDLIAPHPTPQIPAPSAGAK